MRGLTAGGLSFAIGATLSGAGLGAAVSVCQCTPTPPLSLASTALLLAVAAVLALGLVELAIRGLAWVAPAIPVVIFVFGSSNSLLNAIGGLAIAMVIAWLIVRPRGADEEASA